MNETELIDYVQQAFHMEDEKHKQLLDIATMKEVHLVKGCVAVFCNNAFHAPGTLFEM